MKQTFHYRPRRRRAPRSVKQELIWTAGRLQGNLGCIQSNLHSVNSAINKLETVLSFEDLDNDDREVLQKIRRRLHETNLDAQLALNTHRATCWELIHLTNEYLNNLKK